MVESQTEPDHTVITLSPNRSATWQHTKVVILVMVAVVMIIAIAWTFVGAWVILPFAGLEVGLFAFLMYKVSQFTYSKQVITIGKQEVTFECGIKQVERRHAFKRDELYVYYWEAEEGWNLPRISLAQAQKKYEIGSFLNHEDRKILKEQLTQAGLVVCRNKWWQN